MFNHGLTAGHTCSMKETEWDKRISAQSGSNAIDQLSQLCRPQCTTVLCAIQTELDIEHTNVELAHADPINLRRP